MPYEQITAEVDDGILTVTLDRPDRLNAFTRQMRDELIEVFDAADRDDDVRAVIVTGQGRAFCAGADLEAGGRTFDRARLGPPTIEDLRDGGGRVALRIFSCRKPVIAAINGPAVGVGITMTLPMDVRLAVPGAKIGFVFTRRGIIPEACSTWFLPRLVGISRAAEWVYSGRLFMSEEALEAGLVRSIHSADELLPAARELAHEMTARSSAVGIALARQLMWRMMGADHPMRAHELDSAALYELGRGPEAAEGVSAFLEKREARFPLKVTRDMPEFFPWWQEPEFRWLASWPFEKQPVGATE